MNAAAIRSLLAEAEPFLRQAWAASLQTLDEELIGQTANALRALRKAQIAIREIPAAGEEA